ncbi:hypothetical protein LEP1GSC060_3358 [Leptospira weilii serovar Ranarum str. ICFT]|uniref:Transposase (putative) YhgA-like domain-containing protein n=1 Tax=Leptospira weilii serovar Ranarum str. ICFT TaxID=1218598 RepID=N1WLR9_9LEPT|nr:Rpn family recombination-promoting nuclease/putative transposase [Leptospira weilii]EMY76743.1 hypothetical protein LEP1GSC060_3358 [Leptospira weilii serovar Ranarum str. ICFT]
MSEINNPHDRLIRETFQDKVEIVSFFKNTLPSEVVNLLDLGSLELLKSNFISEELKEEQADMLYSVRLKSGKEAQIYILFEHKSYLDPDIYVQLLGYLSKIYNSQIKNNGSYFVVIPFVFYHGEMKWMLGEYFLNQFSLSEEERILKDFIPNFRIDLFDLSGVDLKNKLESITLRVVFGVVQRIRDGELDFITHLPVLFSVLVNIEDESKRVAILKKLLLYIYWVRDLKPSALREVLHTAKLEQYEELTMTTAEQLIAEGMQKGIEKGIEKEKLEAAGKMFDEGIKIEVILRVTGLTEKDLKNHGFL